MVDLDELEALLEKATPVRWAWGSKPQHYGTATYITESDGHGRVARMWSGRTGTNANADLIVAAVNALPAMIAELRELREVSNAAREIYDNRLGWSDGRPPYAPTEFWEDLHAAIDATKKRGVP